MRPNLTALRAALDAPHRRLLRAAEATARDLDRELWLVGGGVRDLARGRPLHDLDLVVAGDPTPVIEAVRAALPARAAIEVEHNERFGTASLRLTGASAPARLDLATLRIESYVTPGALPDVRPTDDIEADLARRDFTVNAMALGITGPRRNELVDPFEGFADLTSRRLRVLHERSFIDDATRLWRGARTAALFRLEPDPTTARLIAEGARWLEHISGDRLWAEFAYTARRGRANATLARLDSWGVLGATHPAWTLSEATRRALAHRHGPVDPATLAAVLLAPLPAEARTGILARLNAPRDTRITVEDAARLLAASDLNPTDPDTLVPLEHTRAEARSAAVWLHPEQQPALQRYLRRWQRTTPHLATEAIMALGVPRGPVLGWTLARLRRGRFLGTLSSSTDARREVRRAIAAGEITDPREGLPDPPRSASATQPGATT